MHNPNDDELNRIIPVVKLYFWWLSGSLLLIVLSYFGGVSWLREPLNLGLVKIYLVTQTGIRTAEAPIRLISFWNNGVHRVADLEERLARMAVDKVELEKLRSEKGQIKPTSTVLASGRLIQGNNKGLIALGQKDGASWGDVVITGEAVLWGRVTEVGKFSSTVLRPFDWNSQIAVRVVGKATKGVISGDGLNARLVGVLQTDNLEVGDLLVTSGADELYPEGVVVGEVSELLGEAAEVTKGAKVSLLAGQSNMGFILK
jgi:cell shape-determining protein MreC